MTIAKRKLTERETADFGAMLRSIYIGDLKKLKKATFRVVTTYRQDAQLILLSIVGAGAYGTGFPKADVRSDEAVSAFAHRVATVIPGQEQRLGPDLVERYLRFAVIPGAEEPPTHDPTIVILNLASILASLLCLGAKVKDVEQFDKAWRDIAPLLAVPVSPGW